VDNLSFDQLPQAVSQLRQKIDYLIALLEKNADSKGDQWFDLDGLCKYLPEKPVKATIYKYVQDRTIPFHKKSKKLFFLKSEIDAWLCASRKKTIVEINSEIDYLLRK
jgi:hypothetical protein